MEWHSGDIKSAIQETQLYGKTFVVFVEGEDEASQSMCTTWNDPQVVSTCSKSKCVAVKLNSASEQGVMFSNCYPVVCVPSTFIINGGVPTDIIAGSVEANELAERLRNGFLKENTPSIQTSSSVGAPTENEEEGSSSSTVASSSGYDGAPSPNTPTDDDFQQRVAKAKELIKKRQEQKEMEEQNEAKEKELKRRQEGNEISLAVRQQADLKAKKLADELAKQKAEERAAREAVRQQIQRDRADRAARYDTEKANAALVTQQKKQERQEQLQQNMQRPVDMSNTRLQFRLPDGSAVNKEFKSEQKLATAYQFIKEHCSGKYPSIRIVSVHPRREFVSDDHSMTLQELGLAPSAAIIVLPGARSSSGASSALSPVVDFFKMIFLSIIALLGWVLTSLGLRQSTSNAPQQQDQGQQQEQQIPSGSDSGSVRRRTRDSNIHRLHDNDDEDKLKKTWNGNSTQQL